MTVARPGHRTVVASLMTAFVLSLFALTALPSSNGSYYGPKAKGAIAWSAVPTFAQRVRLALHRTSDPSATADTVPMVGGLRSAVRVQAISTTRHVAQLLSAMLFALFGLFVLWWGRDAASMWLGIFCASFASPLLHPYGALPEWAMLVAWTLVSLLAVLAIYAFYALAETVARAGVRRSWVLRAIAVVRICVLALLAAALVGDLGRTYLPVLWRAEFTPPTIAFVQSWFLATFTIALVTAPLALLGAAVVYARDDRHRLNAAVIFVTTTVALWGVIYSIVTSLIHGSGAGFDIWWFTLLAIPLGFIVTISTMKVIDVKVVISRILALATLTIVVGGVIVGAETVLRGYVEKKWPDLSAAAQFIIAFGIVYWASTLYHRITERIHRFVFRRQYAAVDALREFAHKAAYVESRTVLLEDAVAEIARVLGTTRVVLYEESAAGYHLIQAQHATKADKDVGRDDAAIICMRASVARVDLAEVSPRTSRLGKDGFAFPMAICGRLSGALVVGSRLDEAEGPYLKEELEALEDVAQKVGDALFRMKANEIAAFVGKLADGSLTDGEVVGRARALRDRGLV